MSHLSKDHRFVFQALSVISADEKLRPILSLLSYYGQESRPFMFQIKVLILKYFPADGLATSAFVECEVITLTQESRNNSVKGRSL